MVDRVFTIGYYRNRAVLKIPFLALIIAVIFFVSRYFASNKDYTKRFSIKKTPLMAS